MALTKNSQKRMENPYVYKSIDQLKLLQMNYFSTATNNACSWKQKMEIIHLICFMTQKMNKKDPVKYPDCIAVLESIFGGNSMAMMDESSGQINIIRSFGMICNDLMWGTSDEIEKPEGITNGKEIKDKIVTYFNEEWTPF